MTQFAILISIVAVIASSGALGFVLVSRRIQQRRERQEAAEREHQYHIAIFRQRASRYR